MHTVKYSKHAECRPAGDATCAMQLHHLMMTQSGAVKQAKGMIMILSLPGQVKDARTQLSMSQRAFELLLGVILFS